MSNQLEILQKKLNKAVKNRELIESARQTQLGALTQFASKLSLVCKGQDLELDNKLAKFRSLLSKGVDFEILSPLIEEITNILRAQETKQDENIKKLQQSVNDAGKKLQKTKGIPDELRRSLRNLLTTDLDEIKATSDFIPLLSRLVGIYHQVLNNKHGNLTATPPEIAPELATELLNLTSELAFEGNNAKQLDKIKKQITKNFQLNALLEACINIIRIVVSSISQERDTAQQFLINVNETLTLLHQTLLDSVQRSKEVGHKMANLNEQIEQKISQLAQETQSASTIDALKLIVGQKLEALTLDIKFKEDLELTERESLASTLKEMQTRINSLESESNKYKDRLAEQRFKSLQDSLTKLPNRAAYDERIALEYNTFSRNGHNLCLVIVDVDHFKRINDTFGHSAGDKTLQVLANALKKSIRVTDFIARFGGEEFVIIMPNSDLKQILAPLEKIRRTIKSIPFKFKTTSLRITISIGASQFKSGDSILEVFDRADTALYEAKNSGRDRIIIKK
ncbi:GGDEF domain-containing protein [Pseudoalteromonas denitrificans]|uniref:diguanylate cyclase n=1 Tax=Pseudoalteromonas denitrificans DSM 6059 TaxID=1123010 RepID=A0A1I1H0L9_9GAMM|nr:GGDEF domain-containing protein [Pseudoalteromonas denitrificans]SFC14953.1 diguanylate cyclase (GGDEF) domain-containing protein [Pseudoalteromonas denitrificans DSM 6059]